HQRTARPRHLELVDRAHRRDVHRSTSLYFPRHTTVTLSVSATRAPPSGLINRPLENVHACVGRRPHLRTGPSVLRFAPLVQPAPGLARLCLAAAFIAPPSPG